MSTHYHLIECSLCGYSMGFSFEKQPPPKQYCYQCGHSILLLKSALANCVDFEKIPDYPKSVCKEASHLESAVHYHLVKLDKL